MAPFLSKPSGLYRASLYLIGSSIATLTLALGTYAWWQHREQRKILDPSYLVTAIVQTGPEKEALQTTHLAEILGLSSDRPCSLYGLDLEAAERQLSICPLIARAKVKRSKPQALYIDYTIRKPVAWLADYQNTGIDREGHFFPMIPFHSPKNLPEIYLGLAPLEAQEKGRVWAIPLDDRKLILAFNVLKLLRDAPWKSGMRISRIDVSNAFSYSPGQTEIIVFVEDELVMKDEDQERIYRFPKILRLPTKEYIQQLSNFFTLRTKILEDYRRELSKTHIEKSAKPIRFATRIVDLRIAQIAFVQN